MRLSQAQTGQKFIVENTEGLPLKLKRRLEALGMTSGTEVSVLNRKGKSMVILLRGTRFAVGGGICENITVGEAL